MLVQRVLFYAYLLVPSGSFTVYTALLIWSPVMLSTLSPAAQAAISLTIESKNSCHQYRNIIHNLSNTYGNKHVRYPYHIIYQII